MSRDGEAIELELMLLRCRRGDPAAQEQLVRRFEKTLFYFIQRIVRNEANAWDVLQKTWIRVFPGLSKPLPPEALTAWLFRVARNTALNHVRDEKRHQAVSSREFETHVATADSSGFDAHDAEEIHHGLDQLNLADREALTLYFLDELSVREMGEVLGEPEGTIKSRLHFAKQRLRKILEKRHDD